MLHSADRASSSALPLAVIDTDRRCAGSYKALLSNGTGCTGLDYGM